MHAKTSGHGTHRAAALALCSFCRRLQLTCSGPGGTSPRRRRRPCRCYEVDLGAAGDDGYHSQYWKRNTLLLDLSAASGSGQLTLKPIEGSDVAGALAFRVRPGRLRGARGARR